MQSKKIIIFDFCETLVDFQTADAFVEYVCMHSDYYPIRLRMCINRILNKARILDVLEILTKWKKSYHKKACLWQIKGLSKRELEDLSLGYYEEKVRPHLIDKTNAILRDYLSQNVPVWIVSGGYDIYLQHFAREFGIGRIISSRLKFREGVFTGFLDGLDCLHENKVRLLNQYLTKDVNILASYSDSITDIPILRIAEKSYVISRKHQEWINKYKFNEIIW